MFWRVHSHRQANPTSGSLSVILARRDHSVERSH
jgi:hypothetical protein